MYAVEQIEKAKDDSKKLEQFMKKMSAKREVKDEGDEKK